MLFAIQMATLLSMLAAGGVEFAWEVRSLASAPDRNARAESPPERVSRHLAASSASLAAMTAISGERPGAGLMRYLFWLWFMPLSLFWGWFGLSYYDVNFGMLFLQPRVARPRLRDLWLRFSASIRRRSRSCSSRPASSTPS
jgi:hypothetical protein